MSLAAGFSGDDRQIGSRLEWGNDKEACGIVAGSGLRQMLNKVIEVMARECHEVLMLIVDAGVEGRWRGRQPASNVSMITMAEPQCGQRWSSSPLSPASGPG
jgi:hypothetical protein